MDFLVLIFVISLFLIIHSYILYPLIIKLISILFLKKYKTYQEYYPKISILISAYNEEKAIGKTLENFLKLDYPTEKIQIIVGSDGSTDQTDNILDEYKHRYPNIVFVSFKERRGKKFVMNDLVKQANGEILVFSDSNTIYAESALQKLIQFFADERVGGVSGRLELIEGSNGVEKGNKEGTYWKYESWIKDSEGKLGILIGANGGIYSIRKELFHPMPSDIYVVDDLYISLKVLEKGKDFLYCKEAIAMETLAPSVLWEFERKVRIIPRSFETIKEVKKLMFSKRFLISYALWSHKIIRWLSPLFFIVLLITNILLVINRSGVLFDIFFVFQLAVIVFGILGYFLSKKGINIKFFQLCYYFIVTNYALTKGMYKYITKSFKPTWEPTPR